MQMFVCFMTKMCVFCVKEFGNMVIFVYLCIGFGRILSLRPFLTFFFRRRATNLPLITP